MSQIVVTSEEVLNLSGQVTNIAGNIEQELGNLAGQVNAVVGSGWQGVASNSFNTLYQDWQTSAANLHQALTGIATLLGNAAHNYQDTENANSASF